MIYDDVNMVMVSGRLGRDPELRYSQSGTAVAKFSLASNRGVRKNDEWKTETDWTNCVCFGRSAETLANNAQRGTKIFFEGRLQTREWEDSEGNKKYITEVVGRAKIIDRKTKEIDEKEKEEVKKYNQEIESSIITDDDSDDLPF